MVVAFDSYLFELVNSTAQQSEFLDKLVGHIALNNIYKGVVPMMLFWYLWELRRADLSARRARLAAVLSTAIIAVACGRLLANILPFRLRPMHSETSGARLPIGSEALTLDGWSSFPSDHAVLFFATAVGLWLISRAIGTIAIVHAIIVISLPRIYMGYHWPSDLIFGAVVGSVLALLLVPFLGRRIANSRLNLSVDHISPLVYPVLFFVTLQIATLFNTAIGTLKAGAHALDILF
ncbi:phosphatase PAP2 family protein, partial [Loktanella sp. DJP18]|uniref:phosphatase PAP2 family protein n=1 Tax=Loktanella sp. DJP18 TaxID=3409788 RepID=UPI003BB6AD54